jgi:hypothetical protein
MKLSKLAFSLVFSAFFAIDDASFDAMFTWHEAVAKVFQVAACWA